ncbi:unnamed protein product, partial [Didymodactylos carnosus]
QNTRSSLLQEHQLISKMIDSLMPPKYAKDITKDFDFFRQRIQNISSQPSSPSIEQNQQPNGNSESAVLRPLHMDRMENVSILFADIVGFTSMSSNKTADQLVRLLADLYGRFDDLCLRMNCEKIATLGDCYYCVSGCPEPQRDHAKCCIEMGLSMINAIEEFDQDNNESVDMRVGVHSGSVNCGIIGTKKFKFDIFSNDVTLANKMESSGKPGYVHLTESTYKLLENNYNAEPGEPYQLYNHAVVSTYFIKKRQLDHRITRKPPPMTAATAAAIAVASGVSNIAVPLIESAQINQEQIADGQQNVTSPLLEEVNRARSNTLTDNTLPAPLIDNESSTVSNDAQLTTVIVQPEKTGRSLTMCSLNAGEGITSDGFIDQSQLMQTLHIPMSSITLCFTDKELEKSYAEQNIGRKSVEQSQHRYMVLNEFNFYEFFLHILLATILVHLISRHLELKHRELFYIDYKSNEQHLEMVKERERADWLLRNILPEHVIEPLRLKGGTYSKNHECVGVMFATLINFHVMYEEQFEGGRFYSRVLNEFYGDIEELFLSKRFERIEKIKTIGSTYMAASGLQGESGNSLEPVYNLMEFALQFQETMQSFNKALLYFVFELRIGFNYGPVTAGVIGTTKLFYDIWGDTVNVASRMDSTGQANFIQVPEHVAQTLSDRYTFELRGEVDVKGKNKMKTYFVTGKR